MEAPHENNVYLSVHARQLIESYRRWTGRDLVGTGLPPAEQTRALFEAPFVVASHGTGADPVFNYGNRAALALFETAWADFTSMPSRLSAEPVAREERTRLLARVNDHGFIDDYSGVRISTLGRRFLIRRATVWNVADEHDAPAGQAVMFRDWEYL
ncbi:MAG: MEKHLA domain-containing protein [Gammaproteobacteria bacterium]|nr:MEKHLA domain-containing protein [Gammaproteobacteria bacterium]